MNMAPNSIEDYIETQSIAVIRQGDTHEGLARAVLATESAAHFLRSIGVDAIPIQPKKITACQFPDYAGHFVTYPYRIDGDGLREALGPERALHARQQLLVLQPTRERETTPSCDSPGRG